MDTLNIGACRTDEEYKAAEERRLADLRNDIQTYGGYFFVAAGLAALGTGLLSMLLIPVRLNILVNIGAIDLLTLYGGELVRMHPLLLPAAAATWIVVVVALGFAARKGYRWAFWAGVVLYGADMLLLMVTFSLWSVGVHGFFIFSWFKGQSAVRDLNEASLRRDLSPSAPAKSQTASKQ
jgi:hypothetical protein